MDTHGTRCTYTLWNSRGRQPTGNYCVVYTLSLPVNLRSRSASNESSLALHCDMLLCEQQRAPMITTLNAP